MAQLRNHLGHVAILLYVFVYFVGAHALVVLFEEPQLAPFARPVQFAQRSHRSTRTIRRWIREGSLPARRVPLGSDFSAFRYDLDSIHVALASKIHEQKMKRLSGVSPGLWRYLRRRLGSRDLLADHRLVDQRQPGAVYGDDRGPVRCPRCGHLHNQSAW